MNDVGLSDPQADELIADAIRSEATVTIVRKDGETFTGTLRSHATDPYLFTVRTGRRGRPPVIHPDDVEELIYE